MTRVHRRFVAEVDERGRISLAKFGVKNMSVIVEELPTGGVSIQPAVVMTEAEAAHYSNPEVVASVERALESARTGKTGKRKLRFDEPG
jgi:hypothetical protein